MDIKISMSAGILIAAPPIDLEEILLFVCVQTDRVDREEQKKRE